MAKMLEMYSVRDTTAEMFMRPFFAPTEALAIRSFYNSVKEEGSPGNLNPEDFELHQLGDFDPENGSVHVLERSKVIARALDVFMTDEEPPPSTASTETEPDPRVVGTA